MGPNKYARLRMKEKEKEKPEVVRSTSGEVELMCSVPQGRQTLLSERFYLLCVATILITENHERQITKDNPVIQYLNPVPLRGTHGRPLLPAKPDLVLHSSQSALLQVRDS